MVRTMRDTEPYSSVERSMRDVVFCKKFLESQSKGERNRDLESVQDAQMDRERILSERRDIHDFL